MTTPDAERNVDPLGRYWNGVVAGEPAAATDLDPDLAATVRSLQALGSSPIPDPAFAAHLWEELMSTARLHALAGLSPFPSPAVVPRERLEAPESVSLPRRWFGRGRWMPRLELAAAALLVFVLAASLLALDGDIRDRVGSIVTQDEDEESGLDLPLDLKGVYTVPAGDQGTAEVTLRRVTLAPGAAWTSPRAFTITHLSSGALFWNMVEGGLGEQPMRVGDGFGGEAELKLRNDGPEPAVLLQVVIGQGVRNPTLPPGVTVDELGGGETGTLPAGNALVTLSSPELEVGDGSDYDTGKGGLALVVVESGILSISGDAGEVVLALDTELTPSPTRDPRRGPPSALDLSAGETAFLRDGAFFSIVNPGPDRVRAMVLTVDPGAAEAEVWEETIASSVYGTPAPQEMPPGPMATPNADSLVVTPEECDVEPRSVDSIRALAGLGQPRTVGGGIIEPPFEDQLPQGPAADEAIVAAVTAAEREYRACLTARDFPRLLALLTDERGGELLAELSDEDKRLLLDGQWTPQPGPERMALFPLRDVRLLPDGRVGAIVEYGFGPPNPPRQFDGSHFQTYKLVDGRWLIDEANPFIPYP